MSFIFNIITGISFYKTNIYLFLWFVPAVITLYLFTPVFYHFFKKAENKYLFFAGFIELWLLFSLMARNVMREDLYGFTNRIPIFVTGFLIGYLCKEKVIKDNTQKLAFYPFNIHIGYVFSISE